MYIRDSLPHDYILLEFIFNPLVPFHIHNGKHTLQSSLALPLQPLKIQCNMLNSNLIPIHPQPNNNPRRLITEIRMMSPRLSSMNIAHMQLNERDTHAQQRIADSNGGMRVRAGVDDDPVDMTARGLDAVHNGAFVVGLEGVEGAAVIRGDIGAVGLDVGEGCAAVDVGFAGAQEVEVGAVDEED